MHKNCDMHYSAEHRECEHEHEYGDHCMFDIWAPDHHSSMNNLAFSACAFTTQEIEDFIDELAQEDDPNDPWVQQRIASEYGINLDRLSDSTITYIEEEVAKRYQCLH